MRDTMHGSVWLMADGIGVLGIATSSQRGALIVERVIVRRTGDELIDIEQLEAWQGTPRDEARSMHDLVDALANALDRRRPGAPVAIAVKRSETTRGRPTTQYDQKTRAEGAAMVAATSQGRPYFAYRTNQLSDGRHLEAAAATHPQYPPDQLAQDAVAAACTALTE